MITRVKSKRVYYDKDLDNKWIGEIEWKAGGSHSCDFQTKNEATKFVKRMERYASKKIQPIDAGVL